MLKAIRRAIEDSVAPDAGNHIHRLGAHVQFLVATLRRHEAQETEIVVAAYYTDISG